MPQTIRCHLSQRSRNQVLDLCVVTVVVPQVARNMGDREHDMVFMIFDIIFVKDELPRGSLPVKLFTGA